MYGLRLGRLRYLEMPARLLGNAFHDADDLMLNAKVLLDRADALQEVIDFFREARNVLVQVVE